MKKGLSRCLSVVWLLAFLLVAASCGSGQQEQTSSVADIYRTTAQKYIDAGDYDSAIQALEEGITATNDQALAAMLEEIKQAQAEQAESDPVETEAPTEDNVEATDEPTDEPTEPTGIEEPSTTPATGSSSKVVGALDPFVGTWRDEYGAGFYLCIGYSDSSKQNGFVHVYTVYDFEAELFAEKGANGKLYAHGLCSTGGSSEPDYAIDLCKDKGRIEASIYYVGDDMEDHLTFYPADMSSDLPFNPYYTG